MVLMHLILLQMVYKYVNVDTVLGCPEMVFSVFFLAWYTGGAWTYLKLKSILTFGWKRYDDTES